jgi:transposase-like protein
VVTVGGDAAAVEQRLVEGRIVCPGCSGVLTGWGHARVRSVRDWGGVVRVRPRRARCAGCGVTHVLLPVGLLVRRADTAVVIGSALTARAGGIGYRRIAVVLGRPVETVRGWLRRFGGRVEAVRRLFTVLLRAVAADPVMPEPAGGGWADAVAAIGAAAAVVAARFAVFMVPVWRWASAVSGGRLLAPGWPVEWINTS